MGFEQYTHARESMLRSGERQRAERERMRDRRTMQQAGNALASGDTRSAIDTFNRAGMIGEAGAIEQRNVAEKTQHRAAQQAAVISGATGLLYVPPEQRMQTFRQRIAPVLRQTGVPEDAIARVADGDLSDETLRGLIRSLGGEIEGTQTFNTRQGVIERDPYRGDYQMGFEVEQDPNAPPGYRWTEDNNLEAIPGGPADPSVVGRVAASRRAPRQVGGQRSSGQSGGQRQSAPRAPFNPSAIQWD